MIILSHRGYWKKSEEKNSVLAFRRSFNLGFGTETDIRDFNGKLVISHDIANANCISLEEFFQIHFINSKLPLALNIKADGLQADLKQLLEKFKIKNYFVFDMSFPDSLQYLQNGITTFTRESEYEKVPHFYDKAEGVWMDMFHNEWITLEEINKHIVNGKKVAIVSPELHNRPYLEFWKRIKSAPKQVILCTDVPEEADKFFNS